MASHLWVLYGIQLAAAIVSAYWLISSQHAAHMSSQTPHISAFPLLSFYPDERLHNPSPLDPCCPVTAGHNCDSPGHAVPSGSIALVAGNFSAAGRDCPVINRDDAQEQRPCRQSADPSASPPPASSRLPQDPPKHGQCKPGIHGQNKQKRNTAGGGNSLGLLADFLFFL